VISKTDAIAPVPFYPQTKIFSTGSITVIPISYFIILSCFSVIGFSYINVFIAGHTIIGLINSPFYVLDLKSQHLTINDKVLSANPLTILAKVFADNGAINRT
jgi:hypothetical protein